MIEQFKNLENFQETLKDLHSLLIEFNERKQNDESWKFLDEDLKELESYMS